MAPALPYMQWMVVVGAIGAFGFGWGTGANDVANAFGTSVGSKSLTMLQATILAAIFSFGGAISLGREVTSTISGGIANVATFAREPEVFAYGMMITLNLCFFWQTICSVLGYNVSSTHSIVGGIIGFALVYRGSDGVLWAVDDPASFPPVRGMVSIILTWFITPPLAAAASALIFWFCRTVVLRAKNSFTRSLFIMPPLMVVTAWVCIFFVFTRGASRTLARQKDWTEEKAMWVAACVAAGLGLLTAVIGVPLIKRGAERRFQDSQDVKAAAAEKAAELGEGLDRKDVQNELEAYASNKPGQEAPKTLAGKVWRACTYGLYYDIHTVVEEDPIVAAIHAKAEKFDEKTELSFGYLQVFSASCVILSHGAGEVGQFAGPLGTIYEVYQTGILPRRLEPEVWCILVGAIGMLVGLATYGYKVTRSMGVILSKLSPSRGFAAELSSAFIIMIAAQYGLPTSSSQIITGAIVGVGLMEGVSGVNWKFFAEQFATWVLTLVVCGGGTALFFAQGVYSPSIPQGKEIIRYEDNLRNISVGMTANLNRTVLAMRGAAEAGNLTRLNATTWQSLNSTIGKVGSTARGLVSSSRRQTVPADEVLASLYSAMSLYQRNSVLTVGQNTVFTNATVCNDVLGVPNMPCPGIRLLDDTRVVRP